MFDKALTPFLPKVKAYLTLVKPGIIFGNLVTAVAGFALASKGHWRLDLLVATLLGLSLIVASACVFNNYIDREADKKMHRTQGRALALQWVSERKVLLFGAILVGVGALLLLLFTNILTLCVALFGFFVYVALYSFLKYRSVHATLIGSVAGAVPPVVGYCAVSNQLDFGAWILFVMIVFWQMPHFYAIAIYRLEDYAQASIPVLPIEKGIHATKIQCVLYICAFMVSCFFLTFYGYAGDVYLMIAAILGFFWLGLAVRGFKTKDDTSWARKLFLFSIVVVTGISAAIVFDVI